MENGLDKNVIAFIDVGSNSIRLLAVQMRRGGFTVLREEKETIRLGDQVFQDGFLKSEAMSRGVNAISKFLKIARGFNVVRTVAVATAAVREANNQKEFLGLIKNETGLEVHVVSGKEEARLIYLGVSSGVNLGVKNSLFIDIGGGSTELIVGNRKQHSVLSSLNVGAIRLTNLFLKKSWVKAIEEETYDSMCSYVRAELTKANPESWGKISGAYGSSGTIINLAEMANGKKINNSLSLKLKDLEKLSQDLCSLTLNERKEYPGINHDRADIIIGGVAILETILKELRINEIRASDRGLNYGLLVDQMSRIQGGTMSKQMTREKSIEDLAITYRANDMHSEHVKKLALDLFDSLRYTGMIKMGEQEREFLQYSAILHDIGNAIAYRDHNIHGEYIIRNTELLGFDQNEIELIASIIRFHMKRLPSRRDLVGSGFSKDSQKTIRILSTVLKIAENLDRSHLGHVRKVEILKSFENKATLLIFADDNVEVELWGIESIQETFFHVFGVKVKVDVLPIQLY